MITNNNGFAHQYILFQTNYQHSQDKSLIQGAQITKASHFDYEYVLGHKIVFLCVAKGKPRPTIVWYKDGRELFGHRYLHVNISNQSLLSVCVHRSLHKQSSVFRSANIGEENTESNQRWRQIRQHREMPAFTNAMLITSKIQIRESLTLYPLKT